MITEGVLGVGPGTACFCGCRGRERSVTAVSSYASSVACGGGGCSRGRTAQGSRSFTLISRLKLLTAERERQHAEISGTTCDQVSIAALISTGYFRQLPQSSITSYVLIFDSTRVSDTREATVYTRGAVRHRAGVKICKGLGSYLGGYLGGVALLPSQRCRKQA